MERSRTISKTQLLNSEATMRRLLASLYQVFRRSNDAVCYTDTNGIILDINEAFARVYGYSPEEAIGQTPKLLRSRHSTRELYQQMWKNILDPEKAYWRGELINRAKDGREVPVILTISAVRDAAGTIVGYVSNALDMSEHMHLQARVAHSEALANLGEMAAVVAHEIRNPLGSIVMAARQLTSGTLAPEDKDTVLRVLKSESQRVNEVLSNFLSYARPRELKLGRSDLNALVREVCRMVESNSDLIQGIEIRQELTQRLESFPMDADQIRQVIWNIVLNGIQSMEGRGILSISTDHLSGYAHVRIQDTGPGIPEAAIKEIFKPFHTTKQQGTGLGLAIADRIVKAHGGGIQVKSRLGEGAVFIVSLPVVQE